VKPLFVKTHSFDFHMQNDVEEGKWSWQGLWAFT